MLNIPGLGNKKRILNQLFNLREKAEKKYDQAYITADSILRKLEIIRASGMLNERRVLAIGDSDLSATSIAIFGNPTEVVVTDIDKRMTDILFEANIEYDLPVRFVYHDMRMKIIEILKKQYSLIITEPPRSRAGIEIFLSRRYPVYKKGLRTPYLLLSLQEVKFSNFSLNI